MQKDLKLFRSLFVCFFVRSKKKIEKDSSPNRGSSRGRLIAFKYEKKRPFAKAFSLEQANKYEKERERIVQI